MTKRTTSTTGDGERVSLVELTKLVARAPGGVYGFVVSQKVYDALRAQTPEGFEGGNSFAATPIVVDPELADAACDVAFTAKGWRERLRHIKPCADGEKDPSR